MFYPPLCPLTASIGMYYSFISLQCSISASVGRFFSQILNLLRYIQIATKSRISNLANSKGRKAHEGCPDSPRPHTSGPRQSDFFRSLFVFFPEVRKEKKKILYFFLFKLGCKSLTQHFNCNDGELHSVAQSFMTVPDLKL